MTERISVRGVELAYDHTGAGDDVVWGHGLTSSMASEDALELFDWPSMSAHVRLLRYDARGHGESDAAGADPANSSWESLARDQLALTEQLGIDRYIAGGASMGCATALHAAVLAPDRITGLLLVIPPTAWASRAAQIGAYAVMADLIEAGDHDTLLQGAASSAPPDPFVDDARWKARFPEVLANTAPDRLAGVFRGAATADLPDPDAIAAIDVPTLILAWTGDPGHPVQTAARLQELMPHAELRLATTPAGMATWTDRAIGFLTSSH